MLLSNVLDIHLRLMNEYPSLVYLGCLWGGASPLMRWTGQPTDIVERFPARERKWGGITPASGSALPPDDSGSAGSEALFDQACVKAVRNLKSTWIQPRPRRWNCIVDLLPTQAYIQDQLDAMTLAADILNSKPSVDGDVENTLHWINCLSEVA
jgi:hypothetical protein